MGRFFDVLCNSLETFHKKFIILNVDGRITFAIYVPSTIPKASGYGRPCLCISALARGTLIKLPCHADRGELSTVLRRT
jgi:hypothetical protein